MGTLTGFRAEFSKMSMGAKVCAGVCCCLVSILSILGVVFLATISILTNKVAPFMASAALQTGTINISNATIWHPTNISAFPWAEQVVHVTMDNPGPFPVTLKKFKQKMVMRGDYGILTNMTNVTLATYEFPEVHLQPGANDIDVKINMTVSTQMCSGPYGSRLCFNDFQVAVAMIGYGVDAAFISLESEEMKVKSLGITVKGTYAQTFKMSCAIIGIDGIPEHPLNVSNEEACQIPDGCQAPSAIQCWMVDAFVVTTTTTTTTKSTTTLPKVTTTEATTTPAEEVLL